MTETKDRLKKHWRVFYGLDGISDLFKKNCPFATDKHWALKENGNIPPAHNRALLSRDNGLSACGGVHQILYLIWDVSSLSATYNRHQRVAPPN